MKRRIASFLLMVLLLTSVSFLSGAEQAEPTPTSTPKYVTIGYMEENSDVVFKIQTVLKQLGYFEEDEICIDGTLDDATIKALGRFYEDNKIQWTSEGISPRVQEFMLEGSPSPRPTATPSPAPTEAVVTETPFPVVYPGERNEEVIGPVQNALSKNGYFDGIAEKHTQGLYDEATQEAVRRFCEQLGVAFVPEAGMSWLLYNSITAQDAQVYTTPSPTPFGVIQYASSGEQVKEIQQRLKELDYFRDFGEPESGKYDEITHYAIRRFCEVNKIAENENGIDLTIYTRLMGEKALSNPVDRGELHLNDSGSEVQEIQDRLFSLQYYKDRRRTGVFDEDMNAAIADFAKTNRLEYDGETLTVAMQDAIFSENAVELSEEAVQESFREKASRKLNGSVNFLGIQMPLYLLILIIAVIVAGLIFLIIRVFSSGKGDGSPAGDASAGSGAKQLQLEIRYRGSAKNASVNMDKPLRIGRSEHTLPLDPGDSDISRQHCQLSFRGNALVLRDYSTNGTEVNRQMYHDCECVIHSGDTVKVGGHEITIRF